MKKTIIITNIIYSIIFVIFIALDQITKQIAKSTLSNGPIELIKNVFSLSYVENRGAAFGIFTGESSWIAFTIITAIFFVAIMYIYGKLPFKKENFFIRFIMVMAIAGAVGNMIDRIQNHYVVDFLYFSLINFPVFNLADCFICISLFIGFIYYIIKSPKE